MLITRGWRLCSVGSDLLCAGEVPVPHVADSPGGELGDLRAVLRLHRAVPRPRVQERHREHQFYSFCLESFLCGMLQIAGLHGRSRWGKINLCVFFT